MLYIRTNICTNQVYLCPHTGSTFLVQSLYQEYKTPGKIQAMKDSSLSYIQIE